MTQIVNVKEFKITSDLKAVIIERKVYGTKTSFFLLLAAHGNVNPFYTKLATILYKRIEKIYRAVNLTMFNNTLYGKYWGAEKGILKKYHIYIGVDTFGMTSSLNLTTTRNEFEIKRIASEFLLLGKAYNNSLSILSFVEQIKS